MVVRTVLVGTSREEVAVTEFSEFEVGNEVFIGSYFWVDTVAFSIEEDAWGPGVVVVSVHSGRVHVCHVDIGCR